MHFTRMSARTCVVLCVALLALQGLALVVLGRPFICECGHVSVWYGNPSGPENSQQLTDWYTFTHLLHGFLFYLLLWLLAPEAPLGLKLAAVLGIEAMWEIAENSPFIVDRYRQSALAQGYTGDTIVNSMMDSLTTALGFILAHVLPVRVSIATVVGVELFLGYTIHDNLTLNIIHLIRPDGTSLSSNPRGTGEPARSRGPISSLDPDPPLHHRGPFRRLGRDQCGFGRRRSHQSAGGVSPLCALIFNDGTTVPSSRRNRAEIAQTPTQPPDLTAKILSRPDLEERPKSPPQPQGDVNLSGTKPDK